ncbi:MAG: hypothetical protein ACREQQ_12650 [Candidatus Binatia bacterium]
MIVTSRIGEAATAVAALGVWTRVWTEIERLVAETRELLAGHLRYGELAARRLPGDRGHEAGELVIGRSSLRIDCPLDCWPARREEPLLADVFGADVPLARIFVHRLLAGERPRLESVLAADPVRGLWISTDSDLGLAPLADFARLEKFFWAFLADCR